MASGSSRLPERSTRGKRIQKLLEEEDEEDEDFWGQEAWREDAADDDYVSEKETSDEGDSDFSNDEDSEEDEEVEVTKERKRPALKVPGRKAKKAVRISAPSSAATPAARPAPSAAAASRQRASPRVAEQRAAVLIPRTVRKSTQKRTAEAFKEQEKQEKERIEREKKMKKKTKAEEKLLTQEELLAEAAQTEIENMASLAKMIALEEETKAKAMATKKAYDGPMIKYRSFREGDSSKVVLEVCNMKVPMHMRPQRAPPHPEKLKCIMTGLPAKYCDPVTSMPYANVQAFKQIRQRYGPKAKKR